jgi:hypothetical protein
MDLWKIADECGIGWLFDPEDEHCQAEAMTRFARRVADVAAGQIADAIRKHMHEPAVMVPNSLSDTERTVTCMECEHIARTWVA